MSISGIRLPEEHLIAHQDRTKVSTRLGDHTGAVADLDGVAVTKRHYDGAAESRVSLQVGELYTAEDGAAAGEEIEI